MELALYKGPATEGLHKLTHWAICTFTGSKYSHCELVIDGVCWTSSNREGGVRAKVIDLTSGRWDVIPIEGDKDKALTWFIHHMGQEYDWSGVLRFALPFLPNRTKRWFCSEACAAALGLDSPQTFTPESLYRAAAQPSP